MWPATTKPAARALRVSPETLRRWVRDGRFDHIEGMIWERVGLQKQRTFSRDWVAAVASELDIEPDFSAIGADDE